MKFGFSVLFRKSEHDQKFEITNPRFHRIRRLRRKRITERSRIALHILKNERLKLFVKINATSM